MAEPALVRLRENLNLTGFIAVLGNRGPTIVRYERSGRTCRWTPARAALMSVLWSATGRVFLSLLDDDACRAQAEQELLAASPELRALLDPTDPIGKIRREVRQHECAVVQDAQIAGLTGIAAPLRDHTGRLCAVLTVIGMTGMIDPDPEEPHRHDGEPRGRTTSALMGFQTTGIQPS